MRGRTSVPPTTPSLRRSKHPSLLTVCAYAVSHRLQHSDALTQRFLFALLVQMKTQFKDGQKEIMGHMEILAFHSKSNHIRKHGRVCNRYCSHMWCACVSHSPAQCSFIIRSCQDTFSQVTTCTIFCVFKGRDESTETHIVIEVLLYCGCNFSHSTYTSNLKKRRMV